MCFLCMVHAIHVFFCMFWISNSFSFGWNMYIRCMERDRRLVGRYSRSIIFQGFSQLYIFIFQIFLWDFPSQRKKCTHRRNCHSLVRALVKTVRYWEFFLVILVTFFYLFEWKIIILLLTILAIWLWNSNHFVRTINWKINPEKLHSNKSLFFVIAHVDPHLNMPFWYSYGNFKFVALLSIKYIRIVSKTG